MRRIVISLVVGLLVASAQPSTQERSLVAPGSTVERIATGFGFLEGPAADPDGNLYFSDIPETAFIAGHQRRAYPRFGRVRVGRMVSDLLPTASS